ncbi:hypothetical protein O988_01433 [Pseudogymnoascus sp. VKM F-3808]|nr:hypothetical protein O988_01433 [Pseudogymnoascus sp. VKM F-3808]
MDTNLPSRRDGDAITNANSIKHCDYQDNDARVLNDLNRYTTNGSVAIPMDVFERMYFNPEIAVKGQLRRTFGNPTPLALLGFVIASTPLACTQMGWRGAGGNGAALIGAFYFFGGMLQIIGSVMEWVIGNTFTMVVFGSYGAFWLTFGATLQPVYNAVGAYTEGAKTEAEIAAAMAQFDATLAYLLLFVGLLSCIYLVCSFRTNAIFVITFTFVVAALLTLSASYWVSAKGKTEQAAKLVKVSGALNFVFCLLIWYLLVVQLLDSVDFPLELPVFDLSTRIKGRSNRQTMDEKNV